MTLFALLVSTISFALAWPAHAERAGLPDRIVEETGEATKTIRRIVDRAPDSLPFMGQYPAVEIENSVISGTSSYMATLRQAVSPGSNRRVYVDLIRGIWVGQKLNVTSSPLGYQQPIEEVVVKSIGWDDRLKRNYFLADFEHAHPTKGFVYQKHDVGSLKIESRSNADNQTQDLQMDRRQYGVGDSFGLSVWNRYMSDVMSGFGDEGSIGVNSEVIGELNGFHSTVRSVDWRMDALRFTGDGVTHPETLSPSRPLINLNRSKWITAGRVRIANHFLPYQGTVYRPTSDEGFSDPGGAIIGSADAGWSEDIVGRFFAVTESSEVISPNDRSTAGGYARLPERTTRRWYQILEFDRLPDGTARIKILRVKWGATPAGSPSLFLDENYSWDGHDRPLRYVIAPGAWVYDISMGYDDAFASGGRILDPSHPKALKLVPSADRGTSFDFQPGDEIEQAVGADPQHPVPLRIRQFDQFPDIMLGASIEINQLGRVQVPFGILFTGITHKKSDLANRKDGKESYGTLIRANVSSDIGIDFSNEIKSTAILFRQPDGTVQAERWMTAQGTKAFYADPKDGTWRLEGADVDLNFHSLMKTSGLSGTGVAAKNLRGIGISVPERSSNLFVRFPVAEPDTRYALHVDTNWFTEHRISKKTAKGFVVEFSKSAGSDARIDWILVR